MYTLYPQSSDSLCNCGTTLDDAMAVTKLRQMRQMPHTEIDDFVFIYKKCILKIYNINIYSDRNDIHRMNSFNYIYIISYFCLVYFFIIFFIYHTFKTKLPMYIEHTFLS